MVLMNYHELTINESNDSPARRKQFKIICAVMMSCIVYSIITSGVLAPIKYQLGTFPGGEFVYKYTGRDYAASNSLIAFIAGKDLKLKEKEYGNTMYSLYLDDPLVIHGRNQRFACGILLNGDDETEKTETTHKETSTAATATNNNNSNQERKFVLMEVKNKENPELTEKEIQEMPAIDLWKRLKYQSVELPAVKAVVIKFAFSNGFVSALVHSYKIFPAIRKYAKEHGATPDRTPTIITTCNIHEKVCTHYVPLENVEPFYLGQPEQIPQMGEGIVNWKGVSEMTMRPFAFVKSLFLFGREDSKTTDSVPISDEL